MTALILRAVAFVTMFIDHLTARLFLPASGTGGYLAPSANAWIRSILTPNQYNLTYTLGRTIGRIAFPIFAFLIVEGVRHTSNHKKYALRLFLFALISEIPFNLILNLPVFDLSSQSVGFTLFLGMINVTVLRYLFILPNENESFSFLKKYKALPVLIFVFSTGLCLLAAQFLRCDYGYPGVLMITIMGLMAIPYKEIYACCNESNDRPSGTSLSLIRELSLWENEPWFRTVISGIAIFVLCLLNGSSSEWYAFLSLPFIYFYNGERGKKYPLRSIVIYGFYPIHLLLLTCIR